MNAMRDLVAIISFLILGYLMVVPVAFAQSQPLNLLVTHRQGGEADLFARRWATTVTELTGVQINVGNESSGSTYQALQGLIDRRIDVIVSSDLSAVGLEAIWLPFTFNSRDEVSAFAWSQLAGQPVDHIRVLTFFPSGVKVMVAHKPIDRPEDLHGLRFVDSGGLGKAAARALQGHSLQVHTQELRSIASAGFDNSTVYSVPHWSLDNTLQVPANFVVSETKHQYWGIWIGIRSVGIDGSTPDQDAALNEAAELATQAAIDEARSQRSALFDRLRSRGVSIHTPKMLNDLYAAFSPNESNTGGCTSKEYRKKIKDACKCVTGNKSDEC